MTFSIIYHSCALRNSSTICFGNSNAKGEIKSSKDKRIKEGKENLIQSEDENSFYELHNEEERRPKRIDF